ncbi:hypothetical protein N7456_001127 [Penicillium angulare]|uniref:Uncharacterized protein n=1 Tax=Penicillium angulare TaxID=116970 RepID=A0A9W9KSW8_9EURO|nr:hypothetical protein N7456_001127 [Penicillium angulare]
MSVVGEIERHDDHHAKGNERLGKFSRGQDGRILDFYQDQRTSAHIRPPSLLDTHCQQTSHSKPSH